MTRPTTIPTSPKTSPFDTRASRQASARGLQKERRTSLTEVEEGDFWELTISPENPRFSARMSKRGAANQLTQDNWDRDDGGEDGSGEEVGTVPPIGRSSFFYKPLEQIWNVERRERRAPSLGPTLLHRSVWGRAMPPCKLPLAGLGECDAKSCMRAACACTFPRL